MARLLREVCDAWLEKKLSHAGQQIVTEAPELTEAELASVPGAKASIGSLDTLHFDVLERAGDKMVIKTDEHKFWASQGGEYTARYMQLREKHLDLIGREPSGADEAGTQLVQETTNGVTWHWKV